MRRGGDAQLSSTHAHQPNIQQLCGIIEESEPDIISFYLAMAAKYHLPIINDHTTSTSINAKAVFRPDGVEWRADRRSAGSEAPEGANEETRPAGAERA
jgi:hypothetical protein